MKCGECRRATGGRRAVGISSIPSISSVPSKLGISGIPGILVFQSGRGWVSLLDVQPRVKICCIASEEEAALAVRYGASAVGLVGKMPSGPGPIEDEAIYRIARSVPPPVATFLLTSEQTAQGIIAHHHRTQTNAVQIVDELTDRAYEEIRAALPNVKLVQVVHVVGDGSVDEACQLAEHVDAILLDSGNPQLAVKELGGTGRRHDWNISRRIVETCGKPVFLAGGLNAQNVRGAIETVQPFAVDVCSGVRTDGLLDRQKLEQFFMSLATV